MKTSSVKAKGRNAQKEVVMDLRRTFQFDNLGPVGYSEDCYNGDITCRQMGGTGTDIILSPEAKKHIPFDIEVKCQEALNIWSALQQAEENTAPGRIPLLVFKRNRTEKYCALKFEDLLRLLK